MKISLIYTILVLIGTAYGQIIGGGCTTYDLIQCQNTVPPVPAGVYSYQGCQRTSTRLRTCLYTCNEIPCNNQCVLFQDYRRGACMYDMTRQTTSCQCFRN
ncbi:unnamed protein product [Oppiella nova]|uniref:Uncharacterized protein n=1 Tax=Oppiella nova TaxID=334625 RepID=A0A7R9QWY0_9ACAR|nr:unnamed protein product [Oppiella nova]CAG2177026.1 unnamed protein product [Oppiella nova]